SDFYIFTQTHMPHLHPLFIDSGTYTHKRNSIAVFGIHIGLYFKNKATEFFFVCFNQALFRRTAPWSRSPFNKPIKHLSHTKIAEGGSEIYRCHSPGQILIKIKFMSRTSNKFNFLTNFVAIAS